MAFNDSELVSLAQQGDRDSMRVLVERYQDRLVAVVVGMVRNHDDALEVVQETYIKAFRNLDGFRGQSSFYTWIYRIAVNQAIDLKRRESRRVSVEFDEVLPPGGVDEWSQSSVGGNDTFSRVRNRELVAKVYEAMESLTPDHRAVIILREVDGLSYEEISDAVGCSLGTVMSRLHYARKALQLRLEEIIGS